jgi:hypothetical protein
MTIPTALLTVGVIVLLLCAGFATVIILGNLPGKKG